MQISFVEHRSENCVNVHFGNVGLNTLGQLRAYDGRWYWEQKNGLRITLDELEQIAKYAQKHEAWKTEDQHVDI
jgi:hypothetical protein